MWKLQTPANSKEISESNWVFAFQDGDIEQATEVGKKNIYCGQKKSGKKMSAPVIFTLFLGITSICAIFGIVGFGITIDQGNQLSIVRSELASLESDTFNETVVSNGTCTNNNAGSAPFSLIFIDKGSTVAAVMEIGPFSAPQTGNSVLVSCPFLLLPSLYNSGIFSLFTLRQLANISATTPGLLLSNVNVPYSNYDMFFTSGQAQISWTFQPPYNGASDTWNFISPTRFPMILVNAAAKK